MIFYAFNQIAHIMVSPSRIFVESFIGAFLFFLTTIELEEYTGIGDRYPTSWYIAKFIAHFILFFLYSHYR